MTSRFPEPPSPMEAEGIPDPGVGADNELLTDPADAYAIEPPHDTATAVDDFGTTAAEMHDGESLDGRIAREEEDVLAQVDTDADESLGSDTPFDERAGQGVGRLVEPDEGARTDTEADMVAADVGTDLGGYSAEEAAMHLEPEV
jgi:hypothetical protein